MFYFGRSVFAELWLLSSLDLRRQAKYGVVYFVPVFGMLLLAYYLAGKAFIPNKSAVVAEFGLTSEPLTLAMCSMYFSFVNPVLEEFFWRVFLPHALGFSERALWMSSVFYSLYHVFVLTALGLPPWICGTTFVALAIAGRVFCALVQLTGPLSAAAAHSAADLCIAAVLWDWYYQWV